MNRSTLFTALPVVLMWFAVMLVNHVSQSNLYGANDLPVPTQILIAPWFRGVGVVLAIVSTALMLLVRLKYPDRANVFVNFCFVALVGYLMFAVLALALPVLPVG